MWFKKYKFLILGLYVFIFLCSIIYSAFYLSNHHPSDEAGKEKKVAIHHQWQPTSNKKMINRFSTFLFKTPETNALKNKLLLQSTKHVNYQLTDAEYIQLFDEQLVDSELLYNDVVEVLETKGDYAKVIALQQPNRPNKLGYEGWVFASDLSDIPESYVPTSQQIVITKSSVEQQNNKFSMGTYLPVIKENNDNYEVATLNGTMTISKQDARDIKQPLTLEEMLQTGKQLVGTRYIWAGISSEGFDCSGLVYTLYRLMDIQLPRDTPQQAEIGQNIENYNDALPGDILLFTNQQGIIHHVGIYLGQDKMLHAPNVTTSVEIMDLKGTVYQKELSHIRRVAK